MPEGKNNKKIIKNTIYLYVRMVVVMLVTLYTSRVILQSLGVEDFGIYNLVFGVVAIFRVINGALTDATQRFITFELGKGKNAKISEIFSLAVIMHFILAIIIFALAETVGLWFLYNKLIIPTERMNAALWVYQFSLVSLFILVVSVPYNALIVAHERMKAFAFISIIDVVAKLTAAYLLLIKGNYDKLILYGSLMLFSQIIQRILYSIYCRREFPDTKFKLCWNKDRIIELGKFASWTIFGNLSYIGTTQGISVLLGMFFLPVVNAARGIAVVVQGAVDSFVRSFQTAVNPQITKSYAAGNKESTTTLAYNSSRFSFFLMLLPVIPILVETEQIVAFWLDETPQYTATFIRYTLIISLVSTILNPLEVSIKATGKIKNFEVSVYTIKIMTLPLSYIFLKFGYNPTIVFIIQTTVEACATIVGAIIMSRSFCIGASSFFSRVLSRTMPTLMLSLLLPIVLYQMIPEGLIRLSVIVISSILWTCIIIFFFGFSSMERYTVIKTITRFYDSKNIH